MRRPTGIDGTLLVRVYSGDVDRFSVGDIVIIDGTEHEIIRTGKSGNSAKVKFAGVNSIEMADTFRNAEIAVTAESLPDNPPGIYYHYEIMGADVKTIDGKLLGCATLSRQSSPRPWKTTYWADIGSASKTDGEDVWDEGA